MAHPALAGEHAVRALPRQHRRGHQPGLLEVAAERERVQVAGGGVAVEVLVEVGRVVRLDAPLLAPAQQRAVDRPGAKRGTGLPIRELELRSALQPAAPTAPRGGHRRAELGAGEHGALGRRQRPAGKPQLDAGPAAGRDRQHARQGVAAPLGGGGERRVAGGDQAALIPLHEATVAHQRVVAESGGLVGTRLLQREGTLEGKTKTDAGSGPVRIAYLEPGQRQQRAVGREFLAVADHGLPHLQAGVAQRGHHHRQVAVEQLVGRLRFQLPPRRQRLPERHPHLGDADADQGAVPAHVDAVAVMGYPDDGGVVAEGWERPRPRPAPLQRRRPLQLRHPLPGRSVERLHQPVVQCRTHAVRRGCGPPPYGGTPRGYGASAPGDARHSHARWT